MKKPFLVELPRFMDPRGSLSIIEELVHTPFEICRCHLIYNVPQGAKRDGYAPINNKELIVPLSGSFNMVIDDGIETTIYSLNKPYCGLFIPEGLWREAVNFSKDAVALVLSSNQFSIDDYIYEYDDFKHKRNGLQDRL